MTTGQNWTDEEAFDLARRMCVAHGGNPDAPICQGRDQIGENWQNFLPMAVEALVVLRPHISPRQNHKVLLVAAKKLRRLRIETVGGRKERPARTVGSIIDRESDLKGDDEFVAWIIKKALRYYDESRAAITTNEGATDGK